MRPGSLEYFLATLSGGAGLLGGLAAIFNFASGSPLIATAPATASVLNFAVAS